ncbi:MAG: RDD family protein [Calditrichaeota bacterium]|nr:RDD family protein [Calditrichota bacterium]
MKTLSISTAQNIEIDYPLANVGERIFATLIDFLVIFAYVMLITFSVSLLGLNENALVAVFLPYVITIPIFFYNFILEYFMDGQTIGKRFRRIKIVKVDGSEISVADHFLRWILRVVDILISSGSVALLSIVISNKNQRLGDIAANTTVISLKTEFGLKDSIYTRVEDDYSVTFNEVINLKDKEVELIRQVLNMFKNAPESKSNLMTLDKLAGKIKSVLHVQSFENNEAFLKKILKDYNYLTQQMD